jgi:hypothetical protein
MMLMLIELSATCMSKEAQNGILFMSSYAAGWAIITPANIQAATLSKTQQSLPCSTTGFLLPA